MSESIEKPEVFLWYRRLRCSKVLKNLVFSCGLGGSGARKCWKTLGFLVVWSAQMSESIEKPEVFLCFGRLRCPEVLKNLRFSCGMGGSDVRKYWKTLGFLVVWSAQMVESIEKPLVFLWFGRLRCQKVSKNLVFSCGLGGSGVRISRKP